MTIRAKFKCQSVNHLDNGLRIVKLFPAHGPGNESWSEATPGGTMEMYITNPAAYEQFAPGKSYYLDVSEAE